MQLRRIAPGFDEAELHYATTDRTVLSQLTSARVHFFPDANKDTPLRLMACIWRLALIVLRVRPDVVVSTGAAGGVCAICLARLIGARTMFIDSIANARELSLSARLALWVADQVLTQWPDVAHKSRAKYCGSVL